MWVSAIRHVRKHVHGHINGQVHECTYRADWEPAAASGKGMAGVSGVFWRCPEVLWGPPTPNPARVAENPNFEKLADFSYVHAETG